MTAFECNALAIGWFFAATRPEANLTPVGRFMANVGVYAFSIIGLLKMLHNAGLIS